MIQKRRLTIFLLIFMSFVSLSCVLMANAQTVPKEAKDHNQKGNEYCEKGEFEKGVAEYEKAIKLCPDFTDALYNAGLTYYLDLKDYARAISYFKRFVQIEGDTADGKQVKKWIVEAGQKLAAAKNIQPQKSSPQAQQAKTAQGKDISPEKGVQKAFPPPQIVTQAVPSSQGTAPQGAVMPPQETAQVASSAQEETAPVPSPAVDQAAVAAIHPSPALPAQEAMPQGTAPQEAQPVPAELNQQQAAPAPPRSLLEEQARVYKEQGNEYNNKGKPDEAVKEYLKALQIYPQYTDALYNIAKTYDFSLKDYANAIRYYQQFLQFESPNSRDAAQVRIWLGRAEEVYQSQTRQAKEQPQGGGQPATQPKPEPALTAKAPSARTLSRGKKEGGYYIKEFLPVPANVAPVNLKDDARSIETRKAELQSAIISQSPGAAGQSPAPAAIPQSPAQKLAAVVPLPQATQSRPSGQLSGSREILLETVIPKDVHAADLVPLVMSQMQKEITDILIQARAQSPEELAKLYLSKVQSDILPSGERISSFRLGGKELAELPYIRILTEEEKQEMEREKWELIRTRKSPARLKEVLTTLRDGYKVVSQ